MRSAIFTCLELAQIDIIPYISESFISFISFLAKLILLLLLHPSSPTNKCGVQLTDSPEWISRWKIFGSLVYETLCYLFLACDLRLPFLLESVPTLGKAKSYITLSNTSSKWSSIGIYAGSGSSQFHWLAWSWFWVPQSPSQSAAPDASNLDVFLCNHPQPLCPPGRELDQHHEKQPICQSWW